MWRRLLARDKPLVVAVAAAAATSLLLLLNLCAVILRLHLPARNDHTGLEPNLNAPVILVADDAEGSSEHRLAGRGHVDANDPDVFASPGGLRQIGGSRARLFLVHAAAHGGGGLVSEAVLNLHPNEVFFLHRPLYRLSPTSNEAHAIPAEWLQRVFNCSLGMDGRLLYGPHLGKSRSFNAVYASRCLPQQLMHHIIVAAKCQVCVCARWQVDVARCVALACQERSLRAAFTTQLSMAGVTDLLTLYRSLLKADEVCVTMASRLTLTRDLQKRFPGSVLVVHHEHLVARPRPVLAAVNRFLGLTVSDRRLNAILALHGLDIPEQERLQMVNIWQISFTLQEVRQVDRSCSRYYPSMGYLPVPHTVTAHTDFFVPWEEYH